MNKSKLLLDLICVTAIFVVTACSAGSAPPTATPTLTTPTPVSNPQTEQAGNFLQTIQEYYDLGYISSMDGTYTYFGNNDVVSRATANYYQSYIFDDKPISFVLQASVRVQTQSNNGGCGFAFHWSGNDKHKIIYLEKKGYVDYYKQAGAYSEPSSKYFSSREIDPTNPDGTKITLIVYHRVVQFLVEDKVVLSLELTSMKAGIGVVAMSGDSDNETVCFFKNIALWSFPE